MYYIITYMNILLKETFAGIFVSIACRNRHMISLSAVTNLPNSTALHSHPVQCYTCVSLVVQTFRSLMNEGNIFREFLFSRLRFNSRK